MAALYFFLNGGTMAEIGHITELKIVNSVLSVAGDNPVQSLSDSYQPVFIIKQMIENISRDMQTEGWWFNTEFEVTLTSNTETDKIALPFNILKFEPKYTKYVQRGLTVYDRQARTSTITDDVEADIVVMLEFDDLPQVARKYIRAKCRHQYNEEYFGEQTIKRTLEKELNKARIELEQANLENNDYNVFNSTKTYNMVYKNRRR